MAAGPCIGCHSLRSSQPGLEGKIGMQQTSLSQSGHKARLSGGTEEWLFLEGD